jgi:hypothetical protein
VTTRLMRARPLDSGQLPHRPSRWPSSRQVSKPLRVVGSSQDHNPSLSAYWLSGVLGCAERQKTERFPQTRIRSSPNSAPETYRRSIAERKRVTGCPAPSRWVVRTPLPRRREVGASERIAAMRATPVDQDGVRGCEQRLEGDAQRRFRSKAVDVL